MSDRAVTAPRVVDARTLDLQARASDPKASAWVSANAGSGKTHVLTQRVKRLLLAGVEPGRILCLTFTKAAAATMANRVLGDLARWVSLDEASLRAELAALEGLAPHHVGRGELDAARRIFARALETPGGLKIQTIHAFCDALLHQFPFEAGIAASFAVLDDVSRAELVVESRNEILAEASAEPDGALGQALTRVTAIAAEQSFATLLDEVIAKASLVERLLPSLDDLPALRRRIDRALGLAAGVTEAAIDARVLAEAALPEARWAEAIGLLKAGKQTDRERAGGLAAALSLRDPSARARAYDTLFRTDKGAYRAPAKLITRSIADTAPWLADALERDLTRLQALDATRRALHIAEVSAALLALGWAVIGRIEAKKRARGLLDFTDLVTRTNGLLSGDRADWVRWKLDRGIDHVLVDEAQDTSEEQWQVIRALTEEFFVGQSATRKVRTLFVVGDDKQSIFSFQGADPRLFDSERTQTGTRAGEAERIFNDVRLHLSFRSTEAVLSAVDRVFEDGERAAGVTSEARFPPHTSIRQREPGLVEIWPVEPRPKRVSAEGWDHPFDVLAAEDPKLNLAAKIARRIGRMIGRDTVLDKGVPRPVRAGDVMILVRRRNAFFDAMIRALKAERVPVAGADRLVLVEHIAVMDLMALGEAVLLPEDDLTFAALLKSPLIGLDDDDLYALAHGRRGSLVAALAGRAEERPHWRRAFTRFEAWRARADLRRPYEFYAEVLGADGGRKAFEARLGREAIDAIDEFLAHALAFERMHTPSLQRFLAVMRDTAVEVKREMDQGRDEVRVMTVHNAKGLEAKVVILPDTTGLPGGGRPKCLFEIAVAAPHVPPLVLWSPSKSKDAGPLVAAREEAHRRELEEYRRLLYVALTRAEDRLIIAGLPDGTRNEPAPECWHAMICAALLPGARAEEGPEGGVERWIWHRSGTLPPAAPMEDAQADRRATPAWLSTPPPAAPAKLPVIAPSLALDDDRAARRPHRRGRDRLAARARGEVMHRLLQTLPEVPPHRRAEVARRFIAARLPDEADAIAGEALRLLADGAFEPFLGHHVLAEVPLAGQITLPNGQAVIVSGQIDRLAVREGHVALLDYKTGEPPEDGGVPEAYARQLALYTEVLARVFPGRTIEAYLLWTRVPRLDSLSSQLMRQALSRIAAT